MKRHGIWLLLIPTLITAALTIGWNDAHAMRQHSVSISSANLPEVGPYNGDPDPGGAPVPRMIARDEPTFYGSGPVTWFNGILGVWAMWYLRVLR